MDITVQRLGFNPELVGKALHISGHGKWYTFGGYYLVSNASVDVLVVRNFVGEIRKVAIEDLEKGRVQIKLLV